MVARMHAVIQGFVPIVEIESILRAEWGGLVLRYGDGDPGYSLTGDDKGISVLHWPMEECEPDDRFAEDSTRIAMDVGAASESCLRRILSFYGGALNLDDDVEDGPWIDVEKTESTLPLTDLDRFEIALTGTVSPDDAKVLREIAAVQHVREAVMAMMAEHFPEPIAPRP